MFRLGFPYVRGITTCKHVEVAHTNLGCYLKWGAQLTQASDQILTAVLNHEPLIKKRN